MFRSALVLILVSASAAAQTDDAVLSIVPQPSTVKRGEGSFVAKETTRVVADGAALAEAHKLQDLLAPAMGFRLKDLVEGAKLPPEGVISLKIADSVPGVGAEGYKLEVTPNGITITARRCGRPVLRHSNPAAASAAGRLPQGTGRRSAVDRAVCRDHRSPRFKWRGLDAGYRATLHAQGHRPEVHRRDGRCTSSTRCIST